MPELPPAAPAAHHPEESTMNNFPTIARGVCILQHVTPGVSYAISCGGPATHLAFHPAWGRAMECCETVAHDLRQDRKADKGFEVWAWDAVDYAVNNGREIPAWIAAYVANGGQS